MCPLCKSGHLLLPFNAAMVVRRVFAPATAALSLNTVCLALTSEVRETTGDAPMGVSAVALRVAEELAALTLQRPLRGHVR
jgi:hypothetical protein